MESAVTVIIILIKTLHSLKISFPQWEVWILFCFLSNTNLLLLGKFLLYGEIKDG